MLMKDEIHTDYSVILERKWPLTEQNSQFWEIFQSKTENSV